LFNNQQEETAVSQHQTKQATMSQVVPDDTLDPGDRLIRQQAGGPATSHYTYKQN